MFTATAYTISKMRKQLKYPSTQGCAIYIYIYIKMWISDKDVVYIYNGNIIQS